MSIIYQGRHGFVDKDGQKYIGYLYSDKSSGRKFSIAHKLGSEVFYINEITEEFHAQDNTFSTVSSKSLKESKEKICELLTGVLFRREK